MTSRDYLAGLEFHGIKLGLDNIRFLLEAAGRPETQFPTIHVGGTNGKGSVTAFLDATLRAAGYRVGRYTSPHILDVSERFLIDGCPISDEELDRHIDHFRAITETMDNSPTYFELATAVAFRWFAERTVDVAIIEVGMGGRFDSTNVITSVQAVITNIDLEHVRYLGDTLEKIAFEKAGIIKPGVPLVTGERKPGPLNVILNMATANHARARVLGRDFDYTLRGPVFGATFTYHSTALTLTDCPLGLAGHYQGENAAVAVAALEDLRDRFSRVDSAAIRTGLQTAKWPCRLERVMDSPPVIIDVAHNAAGAQHLSQNIERAVVVLAVASDKAAAEMIDALTPFAEPLILTTFAGDRAMSLEQLSAAAGTHPHVPIERLEDALRAGLEHATEQTPLLVTGSIFTASQARQWFAQHHHTPPLAF